MKKLLLTLLVAFSAQAESPNPEFKYDPNSPEALVFKGKQQIYERD